MTERDISKDTPEALLENLFATSGGNETWQRVGRAFAKGGLDMVSEASWFAKRGVLTAAVAFACFSALTQQERIELIRDLAVQVSGTIQSKDEISNGDKLDARRAEAVIKITSDYLDSKSRNNSASERVTF